MNHQEFLAQISRVNSLIGEMDRATVEELWSRYRGLSADMWKAVCDRVVGTCTFIPKVAKFAEHHRAIAANWKSVEADRCQECEGQHFVSVYFECAGLPYTGVVPCQTCNRSYKPKRHRPNTPEMKSITREQYEAMVRSLWPKPEELPTQAVPLSPVAVESEGECLPPPEATEAVNAIPTPEDPTAPEEVEFEKMMPFVQFAEDSKEDEEIPF